MKYPAINEIRKLVVKAPFAQISTQFAAFPVPLNLYLEAQREMEIWAKKHGRIILTIQNAPQPNFVLFGLAVYPEKKKN